MNNFIILLWGAHGSGKTTFLEECSRKFKNKFIPIFGDLYGNKDKVDQKTLSVQEFSKIQIPLIIEGKRYFDNTIFSSLERYFKDSQNKLILIITTSSEEDSVKRVNERRKDRNQSTDWTYSQKGEYEVYHRFVNKLRAVYRNNPLFWSSQKLIIQQIGSDFQESWKPIKEFVFPMLENLDDFDLSSLSEFPIISNFYELFNQNFEKPFVKGRKSVIKNCFDINDLKTFVLNNNE